MPRRVSYVGLLAAARSFLAEAGECRVELDALDLPAACLPDLGQAVADLEAALAARREGRGQTAAASAGIREAFTNGSRAIRTLDIVVPNTLGSDGVTAARWARDRRVITGDPKGAPAEAPPETEQSQEVLPKAS